MALCLAAILMTAWAVKVQPFDMPAMKLTEPASPNDLKWRRPGAGPSSLP